MLAMAAAAGEELGDITNQKNDDSPPVLSPSAPLAGLYGLGAAEEGQPEEEPSASRNCRKCKLGKGRCRKYNQPGHLQRKPPARAAAASAHGADRKARSVDAGARPDESLVGSRCSVTWDLGEVYEGVIRNVDVADRKVLVLYDDGDKQWEKFAEVKVLPSPPSRAGSSEKLIENLQLNRASDEDIARALQQEDQKRKSRRERRAVVRQEPPGTSGEPQFASKPKTLVTCQECRTAYSHLDLGMTAAAASALGTWTCGVCLGTHDRLSLDTPRAGHWRTSKAYRSRDFSKYRQICGEQWSESQPITVNFEAADTWSSSCLTRSEGGSWSAAEDEMLRTMILTEGTGEWTSKAARFTAGDGRSASALRQRWAKLRDNEEAAATGRPAKSANPARVSTIQGTAKSTKVSKPKAGTKRSREELTLATEKNCKLCRIGRGQCRHWNTQGHLQSR